MNSEDELELLRQYEEETGNASDAASHSSNDIDSDTEEKIMSLVYYRSGLEDKDSAPTPPKSNATAVKTATNVTYSPKPSTSNTSSSSTYYSAKADLHLLDADSDEGSYYEDNSSVDSHEEGEIRSSDEEGAAFESVHDDAAVQHTNTNVAVTVPQITRVINLEDEDSEMEEVVERNEGSSDNDFLEELIRSQTFARYLKGPEPLVCQNCFKLGHFTNVCPACKGCGSMEHKFCRGTSVICEKCMETGHYNRECPNSKTEPCKRCGSLGHIENRCASLYEKYRDLRKSDKAKKFKIDARPSCYICGKVGHYGHECSGNRARSPQNRSKQAAGPPKWPDNRYQHANAARQHQRFSSHEYDDDTSSGFSTDSVSERGKSKAKKNRRAKRSWDNDNDAPSSKNQNKKAKIQGNASQNRGKGKGRGGNANALDAFFSPARSQPQRSGNMNWRALNEMAQLPQPTRSGTVNLQQQATGFETNFPRGDSSVPRPTSTGVIDLTMSSSSSSSSSKGPRYRGGYKRQ